MAFEDFYRYGSTPIASPGLRSSYQRITEIASGQLFRVIALGDDTFDEQSGIPDIALSPVYQRTDTHFDCLGMVDTIADTGGQVVSLYGTPVTALMLDTDDTGLLAVCCDMREGAMHVVNDTDDIFQSIPVAALS